MAPFDELKNPGSEGEYVRRAQRLKTATAKRIKLSASNARFLVDGTGSAHEYFELPCRVTINPMVQAPS
jgi:hypothetical protein